MNQTAFTRVLIYRKAKETVLKKTYGNYPAPIKILECVQTGIEEGMQKGLDAEAVKFEELILTNESLQLINVFFNMTEKKKNPLRGKAEIKPLNTIAMVGAGFMGAGIAEVSAIDGIHVLLKDVREETLATAKQTIWKDLWQKVQRKSMTAPEAEATMNLVESKLDYSGFDKAGVVIEAVFEEIQLKQKVLADCETATRARCHFCI